MITIQEINGYAKKFGAAYEQALQPLSKESGIPTTAIGILLFFANNPDFATARDICELRGLRRANVSAQIERLVSEGMLERRPYPGDRRKDILACTEKARPIIDAGRQAQELFGRSIMCGMSQEEFAVMERCFKIMNDNIDRIIKSY